LVQQLQYLYEMVSYPGYLGELKTYDIISSNLTCYLLLFKIHQVEVWLIHCLYLHLGLLAVRI